MHTADAYFPGNRANSNNTGNLMRKKDLCSTSPLLITRSLLVLPSLAFPEKQISAVWWQLPRFQQWGSQTATSSFVCQLMEILFAHPPPQKIMTSGRFSHQVLISHPRCEVVVAVEHQPLAQSPDGICLPAQLLSDHKTRPNKGRTLRKAP